MKIKQKSKSKINITKPYSNKLKKSRKRSPKIIDYNKVAQKYKNLLETSLNTSNSTIKQNAPNNNYIDESYYDYIIDNIYDSNEQRDKKSLNIESSKNDDSGYYFTFKQQIPSTLNNNSSNEGRINFNKTNYKNKAPIYIISSKEEMNKYFNDKNSENNSKNISSIKKCNKTAFNRLTKKTKTLKTNLSYKNNNFHENYKKIERMVNSNYKSNKSYNNIKLKENQEMNEIKDFVKEKPKVKRINRTSSLENNLSKLERNYESIQIQGNDSIKEEVLDTIKNKKNDKNKNENNNNNAIDKLKEKVMLLLNLCRKYAYKFDKLFPLCESIIPKEIKNQSLNELKNTIIQYNNMIFNQNISKIFELDDNKNDFLNTNLLNEKENQKLNKKIDELSKQIKLLKENEIIYQENINNLNKKIEKLNSELNEKEIIIRDLKSKISIKSGKIKEFNGLIENNEDISININQFNQKSDLNKQNDINNKNINSFNKINNYNREMQEIEDIKNNTNKFSLDTDEDKPLNTEIEKLDQEIFNLKSKLKKIIQK